MPPGKWHRREVCLSLAAGVPSVQVAHFGYVLSGRRRVFMDDRVERTARHISR
jgi:hypothetical protein